MLNTYSPEMSYLAPSASFFQSVETIGPRAIPGESQPQRYASFTCCAHQTVLIWSTGNSPHTVWIHILDDDSLINIFYLYRPPIFDGDESDRVRTFGGKDWERERWWHKLAQVCQRWRNLLLGSAFYLGLCLVCTLDTPVADMLAHSPPLPLIIDYQCDDGRYYLTAEEEEKIILVLKQRNRVRRVRLRTPIPIMTKLVMAINEEYPVLEYLILETPPPYGTLASVLPNTLEAPNLRHLLLIGVVPPIESRILTTALGMVTLCLNLQKPSGCLQPDILAQCLSIMPQLETLLITTTLLPITDHVVRQLSDTPITTCVTLPNLRWFQFEGSDASHSTAYMDAVIHRITVPRLERLTIRLYSDFTLSVPHLPQFLNTTKNLRFDSATFEFSLYHVLVRLYLREEAEVYAISMNVFYMGQFPSPMGQIFNSLSQKLSTVEHLSLEEASYVYHWREVDPTTEWHEFLRSFIHVKTLSVDGLFVEELSRCLELGDEEHPLGLLPELRELTYPGSGDAFTSFVDARRRAGHPVTLVPLPEP